MGKIDELTNEASAMQKPVSGIAEQGGSGAIAQLIQQYCPYGVEYKTLGEVFEIRNGYTPSKSNPEFWNGGSIPWFRMEDIRQNGNILTDSIQHITPQAIKGQGLFKANSIIMATTATIGEHAMIIADSLANQQFTNFSIRESLKDSLIPKFVFYYFFVIDEWCKRNVNISSFPSVDMERLRNVEIPVPPLPVQEAIVNILDRFAVYAAELQAELQARQQQYQYYRDTLLSFDGREDVEWKKLGEVCDIRRGIRVVKKQLNYNGAYPVFQNSIPPMGYYDQCNREGNMPYVI